MPAPLDGDHVLLMNAALPVCEKYGLALAGGYAIRAHGLVDRPSEDLDLATADGTPIEVIAAALADAYRAAGMRAEVISAQGRKGHLSVSVPGGGTYRVDLLKEPLTRSPSLMSIGPVLALEDAVGLKVGALHDRGLPRDLIDVYAATPYFSNTELANLGRRMLDEEFYLEDLRDQLDHAAVYPDEEFAVYGLDAEHITAMKAWAQRWADEIGQDLAEFAPWSDEPDEPDG